MLRFSLNKDHLLSKMSRDQFAVIQLPLSSMEPESPSNMELESPSISASEFSSNQVLFPPSTQEFLSLSTRAS